MENKMKTLEELKPYGSVFLPFYKKHCKLYSEPELREAAINWIKKRIKDKTPNFPKVPERMIEKAKKEGRYIKGPSMAEFVSDDELKFWMERFNLTEKDLK